MLNSQVKTWRGYYSHRERARRDAILTVEGPVEDTMHTEEGLGGIMHTRKERLSSSEITGGKIHNGDSTS